MKRALFSLLAGLVSLSLSGCTLSLLGTPTTAATATLSLPTPTPFTSATQTVQKTPSPTPRPTDTLAPTPDISRFLEKPASADQFPAGEKSDIPVIIDTLRAGGKSLLDPAVEPVSVGQLMTQSDKGQYFYIVCNADGIINCVPAAYLQFTDEIDGQARNPRIIIWEMMTKGGPGYLTTLVAEPNEGPYANVTYLLAHLHEYLDIKVNVAFPAYKNELPYLFTFTQHLGLADDAVTFRDTGIPPLRLQEEILFTVES